jgi:hypothetical protein
VASLDTCRRGKFWDQLVVPEEILLCSVLSLSFGSSSFVPTDIYVPDLRDHPRGDSPSMADTWIEIFFTAASGGVSKPTLFAECMVEAVAWVMLGLGADLVENFRLIGTARLCKMVGRGWCALQSRPFIQIALGSISRK